MTTTQHDTLKHNPTNKKSLYLIRHAQSVANTEAVSMPDKTIPITELGQTQARALCKRWQTPDMLTNNLPTPSHIYHSQMLRTKQTAQPLCQHYGIKPIELDLLNELSCLGFATVEGLVGKERSVIAQEYWQTADIHHRDAPDADTFAEFVARVDGFIDAVPTFTDASIFFTHGQWLGMLAWRLMGCKVETNLDMQKFRQFQTAMPMHNTVMYRLDVIENSENKSDGLIQMRVVG